MRKILSLVLTLLIAQATLAATADTVTVRVKAMRCEECGHKVKNALRKNPGVGPLEFNYERRTVKIAYDPQKTDIDSIYRSIAVTKRYKASPYSPTEVIRRGIGLRMDDMHCQKCVDRIMARLGKMEGIDSLAPHLDKHYMFIRYDANKIFKADIREVLTNMGYTPVSYYTSDKIAFAYYNIPAEAATQETIENILVLDAVDDVNVNPKRKTLAVTYFCKELSADQLLAEIQKMGIKAEVPAPHVCKEEKK
ncbi:MAG: cation transporter [Prevotella sp.]|nr:cation transporter [Prevotella sp.]